MKSPRSHTRHFKLVASAAVLITSVGTHSSLGQTDVFSRDSSGTSLWWNDNPANRPWFYSVGGDQNRPDNFNNQNRVKIGHNNNTTMSVNGTFFQIGSLEIQPSATIARTYNSVDAGGISFRSDNQGFTNASAANQTFNVPIGIDASTVLFRATNGATTNTFTSSLFLNNNVANFGGSSGTSLFVLSGTVQQGSGSNGRIVKQDDNTLRLTGDNSYQGGTTLNAGTLQGGHNNAFGTGSLALNGGTVSSDSSTARTFTNALTIGGNISFGQASGGTGALSFSSTATNNLGGSTRTLTVNQTTEIRGAIGNGNLIKEGSAALTLANASSSFGALTINSGSVVLSNSATITALAGSSGLVLTNGTLSINNASGSTFSGAVSGGGSLTKAGGGTLTLSGSSANTHTGTTTVSAGTLQLNKTAGVAAIAGAVTVANTGSVLLISASNQVADSAAVTLSGGTIRRDGAVSEVFGNLNLTAASFLDYGTGATGALTFGTYTPTLLLTVQNFSEGNTLRFGNDIGSSLPTGGALTNSFFSFNNAFTYNSTTFTITAIPEPSTVLAAVGLAGLILWPARRRLLRPFSKAA